jgi:predicted metal-dependent hydrolase
VVYRAPTEPPPVAAAAAPRATPPQPQIDVERLSQDVMRQIHRRLRIERERLHDRAHEALSNLLAHQTAAGDTDQAITTARRLLERFSIIRGHNRQQRSSFRTL